MMMRGDCLVRTPVRPWSPTRMQCDDKETNNDSGVSPGRSSSIPSGSPPSPGRHNGSPDSGDRYPQTHHSPNLPSPGDSNGPYLHVPDPRHPHDLSYHLSQRSSCPSYLQTPTGKSSVSYPLLANSATAETGQYPTRTSAYPNYQHSPKSSSSPPAEAPDCSLERLKQALEKSSALAGIYKQDVDNEVKQEEQPGSPARKEFPCPLCAYTTPYRHRYMEHISTHYSDKCTLCDFKGQSVIDLRNHLADSHGVTGGDLVDLADTNDPTDQPSDGQDDDDSSRRSKSKNFRCKQCPFVTTTKVDFWEHTKSHIKAEKLLTCPKCPFVTEYKHHLEYHLRNHYGSKPFKCTKCSYSCVNKSMLNSHLKSHSSVYQYRCADCAYATKYCHSLKLHLRKYDHNPAMVLNQDGSPNPLPIIDVYGTRRGPKQKAKSHEEMDRNSLPGGVIVPPAPKTTPEPDDHRSKLMGCNLCEFYTASLDILNQHMYAHAAESPFAHMLRTNNNLPDQGAIKDYLQTMFLSMESPCSPLSLVSPHHSPHAFQLSSPLDLSKSEPEKEEERPRDERRNRRKGKAYKLERPNNSLESQCREEIMPMSLVKTEFTPPGSLVDDVKINDSMMEKFKETPMDGHLEHADPSEDIPRIIQKSPTSLSPFELVETSLEEPDFKIKIPYQNNSAHDNVINRVSSNNNEKVDDDGYSCNFCDMAFKDVVMYTMHMGYHGYRNPFTCNMCGQETSNRVAFFLHIARQPHI